MYLFVKKSVIDRSALMETVKPLQLFLRKQFKKLPRFQSALLSIFLL